MARSYSWEEVMLGIDVKNEARQKQKDIEDVEAIAKKEQDMMSAWSLGLSLLGGAIFGPAGYFIGKQLGTYGADYAYDWESKEVDPGKFNKDIIEKFNKDIKAEATSQTQGQLLSSAIDLGAMYVQAGGLEEGFDPSIGGGDWTTFGTGDDAWSVLGRGTPEVGVDPTVVAGFTPPTTMEGYLDLIDQDFIPASSDYVPGLFSGGLKGIGKKLKTAAGARKTIEQLYSGGTDLTRMLNVEET